MQIYEWIIFICVFFLSYIGVKIFRQWSLRRNLFDIPNERSSHSVPTARGGGLIIVVICLTAYISKAFLNGGNLEYGYLAGAALIALISWLDDLYSISFQWRFAVHALAAGLIVSTLGFFSEIEFPFLFKIETGWCGVPLTFLWIVWMTNAFNFMDGIDGIAGMQALTAGLGWYLCGTILNFPSNGFYGGIVAFATLGFLIQNWQPAKIFMGDVGSAFLGFTFAVLPLLARRENLQAGAGDASFLWILGMILIWTFILDTVSTFIRRVLNRERVWEAHRGHFYQKLVIRGFSHRTVAGLYGLVSALTVLLTVFLIMKKMR